MAVQTPKPNTAKIIASYTNFLRSSYCSVAARAIFLWDYLITLGDEIHYVWERKFTAATFLFLLNRYTNLLITILELFEQASFQTTESCGPFVRVLQTLLVFALFIVAAFATLRVYATWGRSWKLAFPICILALVSPALNIVIDAGQIPTTAPPPSSGCGINLRISQSLYSKLIITNRATTSAYDGLVLILTIARTLRMKRQASKLNIRAGLLGLLLRDGSVYFASLLAINLAQIIITSKVAGNNYLSYFVSPLTSILISRFLLDLRKVHGSENRSSLSTSSMYMTTDLPSIAFEEKGLSTFGASLGAQSEYTDSTVDAFGPDARKPVNAEPAVELEEPVQVVERV